MQKILVLASLNVDQIVYVPNFPAPGQTMFADGSKRCPGGKGNNIASTIKRMGGTVDVIGAIGNDSNGIYLKKCLEQLGVDITGIVVVEGSNTGVAYITVSGDGDNIIIVDSGANSQLTVDHISDEIIAKSDIVVATLETPLHVVENVFTRAKASKKTTVLNYAPAIDINYEFLRNVCILILNENELEALKYTFSISDVHLFVEQTQITYLICTKGAKGVMIASSSQTKEHSAFKVDAVDTTGAGDTFVAGLVTGLAAGKSIDDAIVIGQKYAAYSVTQKGAQSDVPHYSKIEGLIV